MHTRTRAEEFLSIHGDLIGVSHTAYPGDGRVIVSFGAHGQVAGDADDDDTWTRILDHAQAVYHGYDDLDPGCDTRLLVAWLHHHPDLVTAARNSCLTSRSDLTGLLANYHDVPVDLRSGALDWDRIHAQIMGTYLEVLLRTGDLEAAARTLACQAQALAALFRTDSGTRHTPGASDPAAKSVAAVTAACDALRDRINTIDDAAYFIGGGDQVS